MLEETRALEKNRTWELVDLPQGKQPVGASGFSPLNIHLKGRLRGIKPAWWKKRYTQTNGIDYDETFAPIAKMNSVRTHILCCQFGLGYISDGC